MSDQPDTISVGRGRNLMSRLRRRELHRLVQRKLRAWTRRLRKSTWPDCVRRRGWDPSQKVAGPDEGQVDSMRLELHKVGATRSRVWRRGGCVCGRGRIPLRWRRMYKAISAIETLRWRWIVRSNVLSDELKGDEDLHNKLKSSD